LLPIQPTGDLGPLTPAASPVADQTVRRNANEEAALGGQRDRNDRGYAGGGPQRISGDERQELHPLGTAILNAQALPEQSFPLPVRRVAIGRLTNQ
jgi:hypothetical protein